MQSSYSSTVRLPLSFSRESLECLFQVISLRLQEPDDRDTVLSFIIDDPQSIFSAQMMHILRYNWQLQKDLRSCHSQINRLLELNHHLGLQLRHQSLHDAGSAPSALWAGSSEGGA
jgi:hypothetical protein